MLDFLKSVEKNFDDYKLFEHTTINGVYIDNILQSTDRPDVRIYNRESVCCYIKKYGDVTKNEILEYFDFISYIISVFYTKNLNVVGVMVCDGVSPALKKYISTLQYAKPYSDGKRPTGNIISGGIICIDLSDGEFYCNNIGEKFSHIFKNHKKAEY